MMNRENYHKLIESGEYMHVLDTNNGKVSLIKRDGYYPPEILNRLINVEKIAYLKKRGKR